MKALKDIQWLILGAVFFAGAVNVYAYPPDNAAVLYCKAMVRYEYETDDAIVKMLADFSKGNTEPNDKIREFVKENRSIIKTVLDACEVKNCDWGLDFSQGFEMVIPYFGGQKKLATLILADARILAADGKYEEALSRCMSLYKMARHVNDRVILCYLVGNAINTRTNDCVIWIMGQMPQDVQSLTRLKSQLITMDSMPFSIKPAILGEREGMLLAMATVDEALRYLEDDESVKKKIRSFDKAMIDRSRQYFEDYLAGVMAAFDMPYAQGYAVLTSLTQKVVEDAKSKPEAILTNVLMPAYGKIFSVPTRSETQNNAIRTAIEIYLIKARTGKLPEALPAGPAGDLFSGKPFAYEKTAGGFILRCQGKDLSKDEIYKYEFKVK
jgi:hypothetical protein